MPLGKSGKYYMNPHEMKRKGDEPNAPKERSGPGENSDGGRPMNDGGEDANGDGNRHHELHEDKDTGMFHSKHTGADGSETEMDHDSYDDARDHMDQMMGDGGEDHEEPDGDEGNPPRPDMSSADDMAGMYEKAGRKG
jgi:hypothetical protein